MTSDMPPPTYAAATSIDPWPLIAPYVEQRALTSCCLVSRHFQKIFLPELWGYPSRHFANDDDVVIALVKFFRDLPRASLVARESTHTLLLPPAHAEAYESPGETWLANALTLLPNLQTLIARNLSFLDGASLIALRNIGSANMYNLKYLDVANCDNLTSGGLVEALKHFPRLLYLDLSYVQAARTEAALKAVGTLLALQILKLRGVGLRDEDVVTLVTMFGLRLRSLDLRENRLTSISTVSHAFLHHSFAPRDVANGMSRSMQDFRAVFMRDFHGDRLDEHVFSQVTSSRVDQLAIESEAQPGLTHLYLPEKSLHVADVSRLLDVGRLQVLDCGELVEGPASGEQDFSDLALVISRLDENELSYIRIDYRVLTTPDKRDPELTTKQLTPPPGLKHLCLTSVPPMVSDMLLIESFINLIERCASAATRATQSSTHAYQLPPGLSGTAAASVQKHYAKTLFGLQKITLEMAQGRNTSSNTVANTSVAARDDVHELWQSAREDFSFFTDERVGSSDQSRLAEQAPEYDVVAHIARFRRDRKAAYRAALANAHPGGGKLQTSGGVANIAHIFVPGYWPGEVQVLR
jgi:hypothetical protein